MTIKSLPLWLTHGGWSFPFPPDHSPSQTPAIWQSSEAPTVVIFQKGRDCAARWWRLLRFDRFRIVNEGTNETGRHLVLQKQLRRHRLLIRPPDGSEDDGFIVGPDAWLDMRIASIADLLRQSRSKHDDEARSRMHPTACQLRRLALMIKILDHLHASKARPATTREIATQIVFPGIELGRAIEWKSSSRRRQTQRLVNEARQIAASGYKSLLKGKLVC